MRLISFLLIVLMAASCGHKRSHDNVDKRIEDLLAQMTFEEKVGQLNQYSLSGFSEDVMEQIRQGKIGSILNEANPELIYAYQKAAVEESRLGIPLLVCRDVIHGFHTMFPIPIGLAATFDPELVQHGAEIAAKEAAATGIRLTFSPMLDVARDPRWGRIAEGSGEDTYLNEVMGTALVKGYQRDLSDSTCLAACVKHFVAYGAAEGGRDYNSTGISERTLRNVYLPPFEACVKAGAMSLMTSFNDNDGVPSSANKFLLEDVLRGEWGFDGFVVTDWNAIREMINHGFAVDNKHAGELSINAGVDMDMVSCAFIDHLEELVAEGKDEESAWKLAEKKAIEDARFVLPNACDTKMIVTMNVRSLHNFFRLRCCSRAQWEIRAVADEMLRLCREAAPSLFAHAGPACVSKGKCSEGRMTCGKPRTELIVK